MPRFTLAFLIVTTTALAGACTGEIVSDSGDSADTIAAVTVGPWSAARKLSYGGTTYDLAMELDADGFAHVAAAGETTGGSEGLFYLTNKTGHWTRRIVDSIPGSQGQIWDVALALDEQGRVAIAYHLSVHSGTSLEGFYLHRNVAPTGSKLGRGERVAGKGSEALSLATVNGTIHIAYLKPTPQANTDSVAVQPAYSTGPSETTLWYATRRTSSSTWVRTKVKSKLFDPEPRLQVGSDGKARIAYIQAAGGVRVATATQRTASGSFTSTTIPLTTKAYTFGFGLDSNDSVHVDFLDGNSDKLYVVERASGEWVKRSVGSNFHGVEMTMNGKHPALVAARSGYGTSSVRYFYFSGGAYQKTAIADLPTFYIHDATIGVSPFGNAVILFTDEDGQLWVSEG